MYHWCGSPAVFFLLKPILKNSIDNDVNKDILCVTLPALDNVVIPDKLESPDDSRSGQSKQMGSIPRSEDSSEALSSY